MAIACYSNLRQLAQRQLYLDGGIALDVELRGGRATWLLGGSFCASLRYNEFFTSRPFLGRVLGQEGEGLKADVHELFDERDRLKVLALHGSSTWRMHRT